jgi:integron integrase
MEKNKNILDEVKEKLRLKRYSIHTERAYCEWIKKYIVFHKMESRADLIDGEKKVEQFLSFLALEKYMAPATQNQALNALVFLYKKVLNNPFGDAIDAVRAPKKINIPVVLTREEVKLIIDIMEGTPQLFVKLLYGCGLRMMEAARLRVQDIDLEMIQLTVRSGKGNKDRYSTFPKSVIPLLENHFARVQVLHNQDLADGHGKVYLPHALERKYINANKEWNWQYVFPSSRLSVDPRSGVVRRHHIDPSVMSILKCRIKSG